MNPLIYAHRGASGLFPENTLEAFHAALRQKADGIELDVQLTLDQEVVVIHDYRVERTTNGTGFVREQTWKELRTLSAGTWVNPRFRQSRIPSFREVCRFIEPTPLLLIVELKNFFLPQPDLEEKVVEILQQFRLTERTVVSSFNFTSLVRIKELDERLRTGLLYVGSLRQPWEVAKQFHTDQLHIPASEVTPPLLLEAKSHDLSILAWTVDGPKRIKQIAAMNIDGIVTNYPARARKIIGRKE